MKIISTDQITDISPVGWSIYLNASSGNLAQFNSGFYLKSGLTAENLVTVFWRDGKYLVRVGLW